MCFPGIAWLLALANHAPSVLTKPTVQFLGSTSFFSALREPAFRFLLFAFPTKKPRIAPGLFFSSIT
ncbi:MAG: hypothetical protein COX57_11095 [Alphaproteobacteria bacterium CG_4_10_14_0_2_um_filter_63_37]|nr:MAG: hypothetical protein COX57_11095 [Alphaproteobacteria bacterium CG_4_10_14_0_2_um_filter_63_37]